MAIVTAIALLPSVARADEADTALARTRQNKAVTIGYRESAAPFAYLDAALANFVVMIVSSDAFVYSFVCCVALPASARNVAWA
jgi:hypothetical protein